MPKPNPDKESQDEFVKRCIPIVLDEGTADDGAQAAAICHSIWREAMKSKDMQNINIPFELKSLSAHEVEGHGSIFGNTDLGNDIVMPGAFVKSLKKHTAAGTLPLMFWMHDPRQVPGVWTSMQEDSAGLHVKGELVDTQLGNEVRTLLKKRAVRGLSIGFQIGDSQHDKDGRRQIKEVDLWEVSIVSMAMNPLAQVESVKTRLSRDGEYVPTEREFERLLRDTGCSRKVAATLVAKLYSNGILEDDPLRDAEEEFEAAQNLLRVFRGR